MSRRHIFTKRFFALSAWDQAAVVDAALHDLESATGVSPADRQTIRRAITRIEKKAIEFGIYEEEVNHG